MAKETTETPQPQARDRVTSPKRKYFPKWLKITLGVIVGLLVLFVILRNTLIPIIIERSGSFVLGVPVKIGHFNAHLGGKLELKDLTVGNPAGYQSPYLLEIKELSTDLKVSSLFSDEMIIEHIIVRGTQVTYEINSDGVNNVSVIQNNVNRLLPVAQPAEETEKTDADTPAEEAAETDAKDQKSLLIRLLDVSETSIHTVSNAWNLDLTLPMPPLYLTDIGGKNKPLSETIAELTNVLVGAVDSVTAGVSAISQAGANLGRSLNDATQETGKSLKGMGKSLEKNGKELLKSFQGLVK